MQGMKVEKVTPIQRAREKERELELLAFANRESFITRKPFKRFRCRLELMGGRKI